MVDTIRDVALTAEKGIDAIEHIVDMASDTPPSQEEIEIRKIEAATKKVINNTLLAAVSLDKSWGSSDLGNKDITRKEDITL